MVDRTPVGRGCDATRRATAWPGRASLPGAVAGIQTGSEGNRYVATRNRVLEVAPDDGRTLRTLRTPETLGIRHVGYTLPDTGITSHPCAC